MDIILGEIKPATSLELPLNIPQFTRHDKDDSINGSKTQSTATTESNTPENTVRPDNIGQKATPIFYIENNEVVLESKFLRHQNCK